MKIVKLPKEVLEKAKIIGNILDTIDKAEELIGQLDPDEKNKDLMTLYRFIHSHNLRNSCYDSHQNWRDEFTK